MIAIVPFRKFSLALCGMATVLLIGTQCQAAAQSDTPPSMTSQAAGIYAQARQRIMQIRTLVTNTSQQSSLGSGFFVSADGIAVTNYHVVSEYALEPKSYNLEYVTTDDRRGSLKLLAIDVINDLAIVQADLHDQPYFAFDDSAVKGNLTKGTRLFAMGNPLNLGFTIVEGTYNGLIDHSDIDRIHFTGAINAGMSGGPVVTENNRIAGINVAKNVEDSLVSFLVPARFASELLLKTRNSKQLDPAAIREEMGRQLYTWQSRFYDKILHAPPTFMTYSSYKAFDDKSLKFDCWSATNADEKPRPLATQNTTNCAVNTRLFLQDELSTGQISYAHIYAESTGLNAWRFSNFLEANYDLLSFTHFQHQEKTYTSRFCYQNFVAAGPENTHPPLDVIWCAHAYKDFPDLYDVAVAAVTRDNPRKALISRLTMKGVSYPNATALAARFLGAIQWSK